MTTTESLDVNAPASENQEGAEVQPESISFEEMMQRRAEQMAGRNNPQPPPEEEEPQEEQETQEEPEPEEQEAEAEEGESPEANSDVLSKFNLEELSEEELEQLGQAIRSKVPKRFGELTKRAKTAEERIEELEQKLAKQSQQDENPLERKKRVENNPFQNLGSVEDLQEQYEQFTAIQEWADVLLDDNEDASLDDVITEQDGKEITKREVKQYLRNAKQARERYLPQRLKEIQEIEQGKQVKVALEQKAATEMEWYGDKDSELRREYEMFIKDPRVELIKERVPEIAPHLEYLLAHAANSMSAALKKQKQGTAKKAAPRPKPPSNPTEAAARGRFTDKEQQTKQLREGLDQLKESGSWSDYVRLRTQQKSRNT